MGKSSGQTIGYKYYMPLHFVSGISKGATAEGIAVRDCLFEVRVGDRAAWNGAIYDNGAIAIDAPDLFGGDEKEGGISGTLEVMFGGPTQGVSAYLSVQQGPPQSAHRGLFSLVWQNGQVCSNNPYLKPWAFARRRITGGWHGECWYPEKAPIELEAGGGVGITGSILVTGNAPEPGAPMFATATAAETVFFTGIPQSTGANIPTGRPDYYEGTWTVFSLVDTSAIMSTGNLNSWGAITTDRTGACIGQVTAGPDGWLALAQGPASAFDQTGRGRPIASGITSYEFGTENPPATTLRAFPQGGEAYMCRYAGGFYWIDTGAQGELVKTASISGSPLQVVYRRIALEHTFLDIEVLGSTVYAVTAAGKVISSPDGGETWPTVILATTPGAGSPMFLKSGGGRLLILSRDSSTIWTSEDNFAVGHSTGIAGDITSNTPTSAHLSRGRMIEHTADRFFIVSHSNTGDPAAGNKCVTTVDGIDFSSAVDTGIVGVVGIAASPDVPPVSANAGRYCMNPAHIVYQCLTDPNCLGYPTAVIDAASFAAAADQLYAEGLGLNLKWTHQETIENFIGVVCDHAGMLLIKDRRTGLYKLRLLRDDYDIGDLRVFTPSNSRILSMQRPSPADIVNELQVTFKDYKTFKEATIPVRDTAAIQAMGRVVSKPHSLTGLPTQELAVRCGMRDLAAMSTPLWRIDLAFLRDADTLEPGEPFVLDYPPSETLPDGLTVILRVADEINYGNAASGEISAKCVQDVFSLPDTGYTGTIEPVPEDSSEAVEAVATLLEVPYRDLVQAMPADELAALPEEAGYVAAAAVRPNAKHLNFELHTRIPPAAFALAGTGDFCGSAVLLGPLEPLDVNVHITEGTDLDLLTVGSAAFLGDGATAEMVRIDGVSNGLLHIARGCGDTVPRSWPAGTRLWGYDNFAAADTAQYIDGETVEGKVKTRTGKGLLADAIALVRTMAQRATRPYPPAQVKVDGVPVVAGNTTPVTLPADPAPVGELAPVSSSGSLPGGYVGVPYSNIGAFGDPWQDLGESTYRYVTGTFWPGASVHHGGLATYGKWVNEITGLPLAAGTYTVTTRTEAGDGFYEQTQSVTIEPKPAYAVLDLSRRPGWNSLAHSAALPPFTEVFSLGSPVVDCAGWTDGDRYCEFTIEEGASFGGMYLGVHAADLDNLNISPSNPGTVTYNMPVGAGTYGLAYKTATGSFYMRDAAGWIFVNPTETAVTFGPLVSANGRFRFGASGGNATIKANFGNEPWVYGLPAGFSGVPMPATIVVPAIWNVQTLTVGSLAVVERRADGNWNAYGNLPTGNFSILGSIGKSSGKHHVEITVRDVRTEAVGLAVATFDRADGRLGEAGTEDSIGASYGAEGGTPMIHIRTCFGGVHTAYDHVWPLGSGHVSRFTFAQDHTAGSVAIYADGVLIRTLTGVPPATWYPAAAGGFGSNTTLISTGLLYPVATYSDWTTTV